MLSVLYVRRKGILQQKTHLIISKTIKHMIILSSKNGAKKRINNQKNNIFKKKTYYNKVKTLCWIYDFFGLCLQSQKKIKIIH